MNIRRLAEEILGISFPCKITEVPADGVFVRYENGQAEVGGSTTPALARAYMLLAQALQAGKTSFSVSQKSAFTDCGVMLDVSFGSVVKVASVKKYLNYMALHGMNLLMLYTEDTYEVEGQPFFGYLRGRYTQAELKELDAYAAQRGIELIPCIQTLAHLNAIVRWNAYKPFTDTRDILLAEDDRTYALIEDMFATLSKCFTSRTVNIGMDEAHMVGLGKYLDTHGYQNRFEILTRHLDRVCQIAEKHGFHPIMWSDMFFRLCNNGVYTQANPRIPGPEVVAAVPKNVDLVYWNYYSEDKQLIDGMIQAHRVFDNPLWFAGGF